MGWKRISLMLALVVIAGLWMPQLTRAWPGDPTVNVPICVAPRDQWRATIAGDKSGGAIITWFDYRNSDSRADIYAQRVDVNGDIRWTADGLAVCTALGNQANTTIVSDGSGGAIIAWGDERNGQSDIYIQRLDAYGNVLWTTNGVAICTDPESQANPVIVTDNSGGAIIAWVDKRDGVDYHIYAQRVDALGEVRWSSGGLAICTVSGGQFSPSMASDNSGGAIIAWQDHRKETDDDIYAQRVDAYGDAKWTIDGIAVCTASGHQVSSEIVNDDLGNVIITWEDFRNDPGNLSNRDIYAQRIDASGNIQWVANGVAICTALGQQWYPKIVNDDSNGAIITWGDERSGNDYDVYAQRISGSGNILWTANGLPICTASDSQLDPVIVSDGSGNAIIGWNDYRNGIDYDIYAQRVDASGYIQWTANGIPISTALGSQNGIPGIVSDGSGGAIITWEDERNHNLDIYAQRVFSDGSLSGTSPTLSTLTPSSGSTAGGITVTITGSDFGATRGNGSVTFGGVEVASYESWSDNRIVCVAPAHIAGAVDIVVKADNGLSGTKLGGYTYEPVVSADWPMFRGNPQHTGQSPYLGAQTDSIKWKYQMTEYQPGTGWASSPVVGADGIVYVGSDDDYVYALNSDGTLKWKYQTGGSVNSSPALGSDGTIYAGSYDGYVYALYSDGSLKWQYQTGDQVRSSPLVGGDGIVYVGSDDSHVYALNPDGSLKWKYKTDWVVWSPALGSDSTIYVGSYDGYVYALNPDGTLKWKYQTGGPVNSSPALGSDGTIYVGSDDRYIYALYLDGSLKWKYQTGSNVNSSPALGSDSTIYVGSDDNHVYALNPGGSLKWKYQTGSRVYSSPALGADSTIYVGSYDGYVYALNPDGTLKWKYQTGNGVGSSPAVGSDGTIYVGSGDGYVYAFAFVEPVNPTITSISPDMGGTEGGTSVAINGSDFGHSRGSGSVTFGGVEATSYTSWSDNEIVCVTPAHAGGIVDVVVAAGNGLSGTNVGGYTYGEVVSSPWPIFRGNAQHTGQSQYLGAQTDSLRWRFQTGGRVDSSPAVAANGAIYVGSNDDYLYALNPDGSLKWKYQTGGSVHSSPAVGSDGTIYMGSYDDYVYALNPDGSLKWKYQTGNWVGSSPAVGSDGIIYVGSEDNYLYALNPDGSLKWKYETGNSVGSSPAVGSDGTIYVGSNDYYLYALNPDGSLKWEYQTGYYMLSSPAVGSDGTIYVGSEDNYIYALNPDGSLKWRYQTGDWVGSSPAVGSDGTIYVGSGDGYVYAFAFVESVNPTITSISPDLSDTEGGTSVTINGSDFGDSRGSGSVTFGGIEAASYTSWSDNEIVCIVPAHSPGATDVVVTADNGLSVTKVSAFAYTAGTFVSGNVSGTWTKSDSPCIVTGDVVVQEWKDLVIEPGVEVRFDGPYSLLVHGTLSAIGTETDSIRFTCHRSNVPWNGIVFDGAEDESRLEYCLIEYATAGYDYYTYGGGLLFIGCSPIVSHCTVSRNSAERGGGIACIGASPTISDSRISDNRVVDYGGGIYVEGSSSSPLISGNTIVDNGISGEWGFGGGVAAYDSCSSVIEGNTISSNTASSGGGIFFHNDSKGEVRGNSITGNVALESGGGISIIDRSAPVIQDNTISENTPEGIEIYLSSPKLEGNTISDNSGCGIYISESPARSAGVVSISEIEIIKNRIEHNSNEGEGGGIAVHDTSSVSLIDNEIMFNISSSWGGGVALLNSSSASFDHNIIAGNQAADGGGISFYEKSSGTIINNTISDNTANDGGGLRLSASTVTVKNTILGNSASGGSEAYMGDSSTLTVTYSDVAGGESAIYKDSVDEVLVYENNIDVNPLFVDPENSDYHLQRDSDCIDAGDPESPQDPDGTRADIGAFYFPHDEVPPDIPEGLEAASTHGEVTISWHPNTEPDLSHYIIRRRETTVVSTLLDSIGRVDAPDTSYFDKEVTVGKAYYYNVSAVDLSGNKSDPSKEVQVTVISPDIRLSEIEHDFGEVAIDSPSDWILFVHNDGNEDLSVTGISSTNDRFAVLPISFSVTSDDSVEVTVTFTPISPVGEQADLTITSDDPDEAELSVSVSGTGMYLPPVVTSISPNSGENTGVLEVTDLSGGNFRPGATVSLTKDTAKIEAADVVVESGSKITCSLDLTGADPGVWDVVVTNPDTKADKLSGGFTVTEPDDEAPPAPGNLTADGSSPSPWKKTTSFQISWTNPEDPSGIVECYYKLGVSPTGDSDTTGTASGDPPLTVTATAEGGQSLYLWLEDGSGNVDFNNSASIELRYDVSSPVIQHTPLGSQTMGSSIEVSASISDVAGPGEISLHYRTAGEVPFDSTSMTDAGGGTFGGTIPSAKVTEKGAEYYVTASDIVGNGSRLPEEGVFSIQVSFTELVCPSPVPFMQWRMVSIPVDANNASPGSVLDVLGKYDDTKWRLFRYSGGSYHEYTKEGIGGFDPGKAFWLHTRVEGVNMHSGSGKSMPTSAPFEITLDPLEWNDIATPFGFPVLWSDIMSESGSPQGITGPYTYDGTKWSYPATTDRLTPWEGYAVKNQNNFPVKIKIPALSAEGRAKPAVDGEDSWTIQIIADAEGVRDENNYLGCRGSATGSWDSNDYPEPPPPPGEYVSVCFPHEDWQIYPDIYTSDFRSVDGEGHTWKVRVYGDRSAASLTFKGISRLPDEFEAYLLDPKGNVYFELEDDEAYAFGIGEESFREFEVVIGPEAYLGEEISRFRPLPQNYDLSQNYPNPFNSGTFVSYELPKSCRVSIEIYNVLGQKVATPVDTFSGPGYFSITYDGKNDLGEELASGVYLYVLRVGGSKIARKMTLIR